MIIKKVTQITIACLCILSGSSFAASFNPPPPQPAWDGSGFYVGALLGYGHQSLKSQSATVSGVSRSIKAKDKSVLAGRISVGYNFTRYFGLEVGLSDFGSAKWRTTVGGVNGTEEGRAYALDLMARGNWPLWISADGEQAFTLFGKAGIAYTVFNNDAHAPGHETSRSVRPKLAVGAAYNFTKHVSLNITASQIFGRGSSPITNSDYSPNLSLIGLGIEYLF